MPRSGRSRFAYPSGSVTPNVHQYLTPTFTCTVVAQCSFCLGMCRDRNTYPASNTLCHICNILSTRCYINPGISNAFGVPNLISNNSAAIYASDDDAPVEPLAYDNSNSTSNILQSEQVLRANPRFGITPTAALCMYHFPPLAWDTNNAYNLSYTNNSQN